MTAPRIILAARALDVPGAIVIDVSGKCFRYRGIRRPTFTCHSDRGIKFRITAALLQRYPDAVAWPELCAMLWGDDPDGGPLETDNAIRVRLWKARPVLWWLGFDYELAPQGVRLVCCSDERMAA